MKKKKKATREATSAIKRTNDIMKALALLAKCRARIVEVEERLASLDFTRDDTCDVVKDVGYDVVRVSSLVRAHTTTEIERRKWQQLQNKFEQHVQKYSGAPEWLRENARVYVWGSSANSYDSHQILSRVPEASNLPEWPMEQDINGRLIGSTVEPTQAWFDANAQ